MKNIILNNENLILRGNIKSVNGKIRGVSDCGKFRLKVNNGYKYFNIPALYGINNELYDSLENLVLTKKVGKITLNSNISLGYADAFTKEYKLINGEFIFGIKYIPNAKKNGKTIGYHEYMNSCGLNQWSQLQVRLNPSFFGDSEIPITIDDFKLFLEQHPEKSFNIYYELNVPEQTKLKSESIIVTSNDNEEFNFEYLDPVVVNPIINKYEEIPFSKDLLNVEKDTHYASEFGCSYSHIAGIGSGVKDDNTIVVDDLYYLDFEIGQGIAVENSCYIRDKELSWLCAEIKDINYGNNTITISRPLQETINDIKIEHDNFIPYLKINDYYVNKDFVSLRFEPGTYLNHSLRSGIEINKQKTILAEHGLKVSSHHDGGVMMYFEAKRYVDIDFQGSVFKEVAKWQLKYDYNFGGSRCSVLPYSFLQLYGCDKVSMRNGKVDHDSENNCIYTGVRTAENMGDGFCVHGCTDITLENLEAYGCESDGFALGGSVTNFYTKEDRGNQHIVLRNCKAYCCGRQGLTFSSGADGVIDNCEFSYTGFCKDGITKCWWGNRNPGAGIDFEFESASDLTTGWDATSAIRRIRVTNTKLIGNSYTLANGMTEGNFLMENCVLIGNPKGVFFIKTGNNAGFTMRGNEDEGESYVFGTMQPITCIFRDCLLDPNGTANKSTFGYFRRVIIDNCVMRNFTFDHSGRQVSILNSDLQYTDGHKSHMRGYPRFPLIQNCTVRFRREFIDKWEASGQWAWSPVYGQFQDCVFYLEEPSENYTDGKTRNLIIDFGKNSKRNYVYPAKNYGIASAKNHDIIKEKTLDWGDRECYEVYSKDDFNISRIYSEDVTITTDSTTTVTGIRTNFIISPDCPVNRNKEVTFCFRGTIIDYKIKIPANRNPELKKIYMYFWSPKAFKFSNGNSKLLYTIPEEFEGKNIELELKQDTIDELLINIKVITEDYI